MNTLAFHGQGSRAVERKPAQAAAVGDLEVQGRRPRWLELAASVDRPGNGCLQKVAECGGVERGRLRACAKRLSAVRCQRGRALQAAAVSLGAKLVNVDNAAMNRGIERKGDRCLLELARDHTLG